MSLLYWFLMRLKGCKSRFMELPYRYAIGAKVTAVDYAIFFKAVIIICKKTVISNTYPRLL